MGRFNFPNIAPPLLQDQGHDHEGHLLASEVGVQQIFSIFRYRPTTQKRTESFKVFSFEVQKNIGYRFEYRYRPPKVTICLFQYTVSGTCRFDDASKQGE